MNAVGFLEDLCLGNISTDVAHDGLRVLDMPATSSARYNPSLVDPCKL